MFVLLGDTELLRLRTVGDILTILEYGVSTWNDFITAYQENSVVFCKAYSQSPQTRFGFLAYVNNDANPTSVEFQYYRSVSNKN
mgnify:CR=1 FL=1